MASNSYIDGMKPEAYKFQREESERTADKLANDTTIVDGVIRWNSNNKVPPADIIEFAAHIGLPIDVAACLTARDKETSAFLADYRERMRNHKPSGEELWEMRAAFGRGTTVVNVITGRKTRL